MNYLQSVEPLLVGQVGRECTRLVMRVATSPSRATLEKLLAHPTCPKLLLSKTLGMAIVVGSSLVKLPQLVAIVAAGSAAGVSFTAYLLESLGYSLSLGYNVHLGNPISTYGEMAAVLAQNMVILLYMAVLSRSAVKLLLAAGVLGSINYLLLFTPHITTEQYALLQAATIPISLASKVPQILSNYWAGHTGQLSLITTLLFFAGSAARVFTTQQEIKDESGVILAGYVLASVLNAILLLQVLASSLKKRGGAARLDKGKQKRS